jgi:sterol 24-C-methyltransferase
LDAGCGIGGPMRAIARFSGAHITGVTINAYQVERAKYLNRSCHLTQLTQVLQGDFQDLKTSAKIMPGTFDAAYAIEATCHSPNKVVCFTEIYNALKPGAMFAVYEWCMTPLYNPKSQFHRDIKSEIERGNALPTLPLQEEVVDAFVKAGFEIIEACDVHVETTKMLGSKSVPWYATLQGGISLSQWKHTRMGRKITQTGVDVLEKFKIAPTGVAETHRMLCRAADALALGGENGIFTPMYLVIGKKPSITG